MVDELFENYLSRPNVRQPILTQYCDGQRVSCPNWMSQWGSKYLADQGYTAVEEIIWYYYGDNMYVNYCQDRLSGIPASWPGYDSGYRRLLRSKRCSSFRSSSTPFPTIIP